MRSLPHLENNLHCKAGAVPRWFSLCRFITTGRSDAHSNQRSTTRFTINFDVEEFMTRKHMSGVVNLHHHISIQELSLRFTTLGLTIPEKVTPTYSNMTRCSQLADLGCCHACLPIVSRILCGEKTFGWWQLKYFVIEISPLSLGKWTKFHDHIFPIGLVQPPTRFGVLEYFFATFTYFGVGETMIWSMFSARLTVITCVTVDTYMYECMCILTPIHIMHGKQWAVFPSKKKLSQVCVLCVFVCLFYSSDWLFPWWVRVGAPASQHDFEIFWAKWQITNNQQPALVMSLHSCDQDSWRDQNQWTKLA